MTKELDENLYGLVALEAYKDGTYIIKTSMDFDETYQLVLDALRDLEDGTLEGLEDFSGNNATKH